MMGLSSGGMSKNNSYNPDSYGNNGQGNNNYGQGNGGGGSQSQPSKLKITQEMVGQLSNLFAAIGMQGVYTDNQLFNALKQSKGDANAAMDIILNGQLEEQSSSSNNNNGNGQRVQSSTLAIPGSNNNWMNDGQNQINSNGRPMSAGGSSSRRNENADHSYAGGNQGMNVREKKKEPLATDERTREDALPSGLKNIGNSK